VEKMRQKEWAIKGFIGTSETCQRPVRPRGSRRHGATPETAEAKSG
jgi:hypothetical protein